jgi:hypothetical protein
MDIFTPRLFWWDRRRLRLGGRSERGQVMEVEVPQIWILLPCHSTSCFLDQPLDFSARLIQ